MPEINAITLVTVNMAQSVRFWTVAGLETTFGGPDDTFTSMRLGDNYVNLTLEPGHRPGFWGRVIFHVPSPDAMWQTFRAAGYETMTDPADAPWGERYFHIRDPDGHELSFASRLTP